MLRIVIGGGDEVALRLAEALMHDHAITLVLSPNENDPRIPRFDANVVIGRVTSSRVLREAGVDEADLYVGSSSVDEQNLISCVTAARLGAKRTVCFQFRPDAQAPADELEDLAESLGIDIVLAPAELLAEEILRIIAVPGALDVAAFAGGRVHLLQHKVEEGAPITRGPLKDIGVPQGVVLVMGSRDGELFLPKGPTQFEAGDKLTAMGTMAGINRLLSGYLYTDGSAYENNRCAIVGGGVVGLSVALGLEEAGWRVKVIESKKERCEEIAELIKGLVLHGDGTDIELLEEEQIGESSVLVAVTSNDEKNLLVSLLARNLGVKRIVTRATHEANERLFEKVGIDVVRSARGAAVNSVLRQIDDSREMLLAEIEHGDAEVIELELPEDLPPVPLLQMKSEFFAIIGAILRKGRVIIPRGSDVVQGGDHILVFCTKPEEEGIRDFFLNRLHDLAQED